MRRVAILAVIVLFALALCQTSHAEMIFSDGFESGNFSAWTSSSGNWTTSGGNTYSGSKRAQVFGPYASSGDILLLAQPLSGYKNIKVEYWARVYDGLESNDSLFVEWSPDGGSNWNLVSAYINAPASTDWHSVSYLLPAAADDNTLFQLRIRSRLNNASDCIYFDGIALSGDPIPEPASALIFLSCLFCQIVRRKH